MTHAPRFTRPQNARRFLGVANARRAEGDWPGYRGHALKRPPCDTPILRPGVLVTRLEIRKAIGELHLVPR